MTAPRQVLPNTTYMVTRRCSERRFFLRPSPIVKQIFSYCIAYAAEQTGVLLHAWTCLSNHYHAVVSDPHGRLPEFMAHLNRLVGKCLNAELGRFESLWSPERYSAVSLETEQDVLDKTLYVLANPVQAGLVESWNRWPGAVSGPRACASMPRRVRRPDVFFRDGGFMPETLQLQATVPPCFEHLTTHQFATMLAKRLQAHEASVLEQLAAKGGQLLGREAVLAQNPFDCPVGYDPRFRLNPRVACKDKWRRVEALKRLKSFLNAYRDAWEKFKAGFKDVLFPAGTYWMVRHAGCATVCLQ